MATNECPKIIGPDGIRATPTGTVTARAERKATSFTLSIECIHPELLNDFYKNIIFGRIMTMPLKGPIQDNYYIENTPLLKLI
jgi:hypothetical protein